MNHDDGVLELFRKAAADREHGASEIEFELIRGLIGLGADVQSGALEQGGRLLAAGQPVMANLRSLAAAAESAEGPAKFFRWIAERAAILNEIPDRLAANTWASIESADNVVTISRSSAVAAALEGAWKRGWRGKVVVLDGAASGHGSDQARALAASGEVISRPDAAACEWLDLTNTVVLVGADAVGKRRFVNSLGTRALLELALHRGVDRVLVADSLKNVDEEIVEEIIRRAPLHREEDHREWRVFEGIPLDLVTTRVAE